MKARSCLEARVTNSSSETIPKERQSAYQRWELASLHRESVAANEDAARRNELEAEAAGTRTQARADGYAAGLAAAAAEKSRLESLLRTLGETARDYEQHLADEVLDLALVIARQLVGEALSVRRDFILPVVAAGLAQLPHSVQRVLLLLNPDDLELVRRHLDNQPLGQACHLLPDAKIAPGGCRIESELCDVDGMLPSRWKRLLLSLGRTDEWLEPA